jgi:uncharacterized protein YqeY
MALMEQISEEVKTAMKAKDKFKLSVLRMLLAEFKLAMTSDQRTTTIDDETALKLIQKYKKKLMKSIDAYPEGEKREQIAKEIELVDSYIPKA